MAERQLRKIPIDKIKIPNIRISAEFDEETLAYLRSSIEKFGFFDPIDVRPLENGFYELTDGLHRLQVLKERGHTEIEAFVEEMNDKQAMERNIATSLAKGRTNPVAVGQVFAELIKAGETPQSLAEKFGKNVRFINLYLAIGTMEKQFQEALDRGKLSVGVIEKALELESDPEINQALEYAMVYKYTIKEMEQYVRNRKEELKKYQEWSEKMGYEEAPKPKVTHELAYATKCSSCQQEVDSRFIRGGAFCRSCLYILHYVIENLGTPDISIPTLEQLIREHTEKVLYEKLKAKFEPESYKEEKRPPFERPGQIQSSI